MSELPSPEGTSRSKALENTQSYVVGGDKPHIIRQLTPEEINPHANEPQPGTSAFDARKAQLLQEAGKIAEQDKANLIGTQKGKETLNNSEQPLGTTRIFRNMNGDLEKVLISLPVNSARELASITGPDASQEKKQIVNDLLMYSPTISIDAQTGVMRITSKDNPNGVTLARALGDSTFNAGIIVDEGQLPPEDRMLVRRPPSGHNGYSLMTDYLFATEQQVGKDPIPAMRVVSRATAQRGESVIYLDTTLNIPDLSGLISDIDSLTKGTSGQQQGQSRVVEVETLSFIPLGNLLVNVGQTASDSLPETGVDSAMV